MSSTANNPYPNSLADAAPIAPTTTGSDSLEQAMHRVMASVHKRNAAIERRKSNRYPYPKLVRLVPLDDRDQVTGDSVVVVAKLLSSEGMGFFHPQPLVHRRVLVLLDAGSDETVSIVMDVSWCRFTRHGWYESGGRFLYAIPPASA